MEYREEQDGDANKWEEYLKERGLEKDHQKISRKFPEKENQEDDESGIGIQSFDQNQMEVDIYLWHFCSGPSSYYAELMWTYKWDDGAEGAPPSDVAGLTWDINWWDFPRRDWDEVTRTTGYPEVNGSASNDASGGGIVFNANDQEVTEDYGSNPDPGDVDFTNAAGVYLEKAGPDYNDRRIAGTYTHLWNGVEIKNISVGFPSGVSVAVGDTDARWSYGQDMLVVGQDESRYCE